MSESMTVIAERFVRQGWVEVEGAIDAAYCEARVQHGFERLGITEADPSTWPTGWHNLPPVEAPGIEEIAPRAAAVLYELVGGKEAITFAGIPDNLIFNFPDPTTEWWPPHAWTSPGAGYHKDGDWFRHFLDSPEQGILGIIFWRDVTERQGPTYLATDSVGPVAALPRRPPRGHRSRSPPVYAMARRMPGLPAPYRSPGNHRVRASVHAPLGVSQRN